MPGRLSGKVCVVTGPGGFAILVGLGVAGAGALLGHGLRSAQRLAGGTK
jgi:hypothetical protein